MDHEDGFRTAPPRRGNPLLTFARDNLALLVPIVGALIFFYRCIIVSEGDPNVAFTLVTQTSVGDAIRALLFAVMPIMLLASAFIVSFASVTRIMQGGWRKSLGIGIAGLALSVALSMGWVFLSGRLGISDPLELALLILLPPIAAVPLAIELHEARSRERDRAWRDRAWRDRAWPDLAFAVVLAGAMVFIILSLLGSNLGGKNFWLPPERLDFKNGAPFTGYVLKVSQDHLIILNDNPRVIIEKDKEDLEDRDYCYPKDHKARSSNVKSDAPVCPGSVLWPFRYRPLASRHIGAFAVSQRQRT